MEKITDLLNNFSLEKYIPKLDTLMGWVQWLISLAIRVGPICILVLGLIYLLIPPKEANRKAGFRTYFGMGSVMAWNFTQRVSGLLMVPTGLILTLIAYAKVGKFSDMDLMTMAQSAVDAIKGQVICAFIIYVFMFVLTAVMFTRKGDCRFPALTAGAAGKWFFKDEVVEVRKIPVKKPVKAEEPVYEVQGEQVITADDIVIEDL